MMEPSPIMLAVGWCLHAIFVLTALVGVALFFVWAVKLKPDELKKWVKWLLIIGIIGSLLTAGFSMRGWRSMGDRDWADMMNVDQGYIQDGKVVPGRMMDALNPVMR